jgi:phage portal protein BeeE
VLHVRLGSDPVAPWSGTPPLRRAALSANLLHEIEAALRDTFRDAPFGSQTLPLPAITQAQMDQYSDGFRGRRGRTLLFASDITGEMIKAPAPAQLTPRLSDAETVAHLDAARGAIAMAFGVLPGLLNPATTGPMVREAQRHLATWTLQPIAELLAEEATVKLGGAVSIDVHRALQSFDAGGSARALAGIMQALATAKDAGLSDAQVAAAFGALDWNEARG